MTNLVFENKYMIDEHTLLGLGSFGKVFRGYDLTNKNQLIACKKIQKITVEKDEKHKKLFKSEINLQSSIHSAYTVQLYKVYYHQGEYYLILEYCDGGDLKSYVLKNGPLTEQKSIEYLLQILAGLRALHKKSVAHRDLKPANILMRGDNLKIGDFGSSRTLDIGNEGETFIGSPLFLAPEIQEREDYGFEVDIFSLGVLLYFLLFKDYPFSGKNVFEINNCMKQQQIDFSKNGVSISNEMIDFITKLLKYDRTQRIKWSQIYEHEIITNYLKNDQYMTNLINAEIHMYQDPKFSSLQGQKEQQYQSNSNMNIQEVQPNNKQEYTEYTDQDHLIGCQKYFHQINIYNYLNRFVDSIKKLANLVDNYQIVEYLVVKKQKNLNQMLLKNVQEKKNIFKMKSFDDFMKTKDYEKIQNKLNQDSERIKTNYKILQQSASKQIQNDDLRQEIASEELTSQFDVNYFNTVMLYTVTLQKQYLVKEKDIRKQSEIFKTIIFGIESCKLDQLFKHKINFNFQQHEQSIYNTNPNKYLEFIETKVNSK